MGSGTRDAAIRLAAFTFLDAQRARHGDAVPWSVLHQGFTYDGRRVPLVSQQGALFRKAV